MNVNAIELSVLARFRKLIPLFAIVLLFPKEGLTTDTDRNAYFEKLVDEYTAAFRSWSERLSQTKDNLEWIAIYDEYPPAIYAAKFIALADTEDHDNAAFKSLEFVIGMESGVGCSDRLFFPFYQNAIDLFLRDHRDKNLRPICRRLSLCQNSETFLRTLASAKNDPAFATEATLALGELCARKRLLVISKWRFKTVETNQKTKHLNQRTWPNLVKYLEGADEKSLYEEAEGCFERVITKSHLPANDESVLRLADVAAKNLYELRHLSPGRPAPVILGADIEENEMNLVDFRGRVVLLVFWASWCGPCMADIPHEKELFDHFQGRPFTIVGVNADDSRDDALKVVRDNRIPWRSFWNGDLTEKDSITSNWNVDRWPMVYVIDHLGIIRYKNIRGSKLDAPLEELVEAAEKHQKLRRSP